MTTKQKVKKAVFKAMMAALQEALESIADDDLTLEEIWNINMAGVKAGVQEAGEEYTKLGFVWGKYALQVHGLIDMLDSQAQAVGKFLHWDHPLIEWKS